jgi:hypothetical protein
MRATKFLYYVLIICFITSCEEDDNRAFSNENGRYVRFFLQLDNNNSPLEFPEIDLGITAVEEYTKDNVRTLKVPVALSSEPLEETVTVRYDATITGLEQVSLMPAQFTFSGTQLVDTLYIEFNQIWDPADDPSIQLSLQSTSDPEIQIGFPNDMMSNQDLTINLEEVVLQYAITGTNRLDLNGLFGEELTFDVEFPNGFVRSDIEDFEFFTATQSNFEFELEREIIPQDNLVRFTFTVQEDFTNDDLLYNTTLAINQIDGYEQAGVPNIQFIRNPLTPRDIAANPAGRFTDPSNNFYRTFGLHWFDFNADGVCSWQDFNAFTNPVIVDQNDPNAILGDDRGTSDPSDDIYYHAFRISFNANNDGFTTNPFDLKRWFTNEATSAQTSPGFNMIPAMEFFPENGNSITQGTVQVIQQTLQIGTTASNGSVTEFLDISGTGTYREIMPGLMEITIDVSVTNQRLFGGTRTDSYRIYNSSDFTDPADLGIDCKIPIAL